MTRFRLERARNQVARWVMAHDPGLHSLAACFATNASNLPDVTFYMSATIALVKRGADQWIDECRTHRRYFREKA
jgi:hypothetical protein